METSLELRNRITEVEKRITEVRLQGIVLEMEKKKKKKKTGTSYREIRIALKKKSEL